MPAHKMILLLTTFALLLTLAPAQYVPTWESLDSRPIPQWWQDAKLGFKMHWGVYAVPSFGRETGKNDTVTWFWWYWQGEKAPEYVDFMKQNYPPDFTYADFGKDFTAEFFDPEAFAELIQYSGVKYFMLTAKHHDGYCMWPSETSFNWNSVDVGPKRNLVGDLLSAVRNKTDVRIGLYHSLYEWFNPLYLQDKENNFTTHRFVDEKTMPELYDLVNTYKPEIVYSDGDWEAVDTYWRSKDFLTWLYNESPVKDTVVTNDRWGINCKCKHGGYVMCGDRFVPGTYQKRKFETNISVDKHAWGSRRNAKLDDYLTIEEILKVFAMTISCNGNMQINVPATADGRITPIYEERLRQLGDWMKVNGDVVTGSIPWKYQNDTITEDVWYICKVDDVLGTVVYAIVLKWPEDGFLPLGAPAPTLDTQVSLVGRSGYISWDRSNRSQLTISLPALSSNQLPCQWAWILKITHLA